MQGPLVLITLPYRKKLSMYGAVQCVRTPLPTKLLKKKKQELEQVRTNISFVLFLPSVRWMNEYFWLIHACEKRKKEDGVVRGRFIRFFVSWFSEEREGEGCMWWGRSKYWFWLHGN